VLTGIPLQERGRAGFWTDCTGWTRGRGRPKGRNSHPARAPLRPLHEEQRTEEKPRKSKTPLIVVIVILVLAALGGAFYYYWIEYLGAGDKRLSIKGLEGQELVARRRRSFSFQVSWSTGPPNRESTSCSGPSSTTRKALCLRKRMCWQAFQYQGGGCSHAEVRRRKKDKRVQADRQGRLEGGERQMLPFSVIFFDEGFERAKEFTIEIIDSPLL